MADTTRIKAVNSIGFYWYTPLSRKNHRSRKRGRRENHLGVPKTTINSFKIMVKWEKWGEGGEGIHDWGARGEK